jgi:hypothetical protein
MDDIDRDIDAIMEEVENLEPGERAEQSTPANHVFADRNIFQGYVNSSTGEITRDEPYIAVYDHTPGFNAGETGYGRVRGVGNTGYLPLEVQSTDTLPNPRYQDSGYMEVAVEHDDITVEKDTLATIQVIPYDPEQLTSESWRDVLDSYDAEDSNIRNSDLA